MQIFGLTGGMGSGKSTVAAALAEAGFPVVDADVLAREIVEPGQPALAELAAAFGEDILLPDGSLDRPELARRAFASEERRLLLNTITHPHIARRKAERLAELAAAGEQAVIYDMPLLIETGEHENMDGVIVVLAPEEVRLDRLVAHRGVDRDDAARRIASQATDEQRCAAATWVLDNSGELAELTPQIEALIEELRARSTTA